MDSPLGRALLGKSLDAELTVEVPGGTATYVIVAVEYLA
jgi:transcription elongation factor GreB